MQPLPVYDAAMKTVSFQDLVMCLYRDQPPRVWSLLVTVFGELAQQEGSQISGALLRQLSDLIGIKPEAVRVALHRLRKDGWIDSERRGRGSVYFLTRWGREQSAQATPRIYAQGPAADHAWLALYDPGEAAPDDACGAWISSHMAITARRPEAPDSFVSALDVARPLPSWMAARLCTVQMVEMSQDFDRALAALNGSLAARPDLNDLEVAALRVLLVHSWRRIILKVPPLPDFTFPSDWRGVACRQGVTTLLTRYAKRDLDTLETAVAGDSAE